MTHNGSEKATKSTRLLVSQCSWWALSLQQHGLLMRCSYTAGSLTLSHTWTCGPTPAFVRSVGHDNCALVLARGVCGVADVVYLRMGTEHCKLFTDVWLAWFLQVLRHVSESLTAYMQQASCTDPNTSSIQHQQRTTHAAGLKQTAAGPQPLGSAECNIPGAPNNNSRGAISHRNSSRIDSKTASNTGSTIAVAPEQQVPCVMLLCGADLLATIAQPGVWKDPDIILRDYGIVCICREGTNMQQLFGQPESLLHKYRNNIIVHEEPVPNGMSSTKVRQLLADDQPVRYLLPDSVIAYIKQHGLYKV